MKTSIDMEIRVPNQTSYLGMVGRIGEDLVRQMARYHGDRDTLAHHLNVVLTEAMANAIRHANQADPDKEIVIRISATEREIVIRVYDSGSGFDLSSIPEPSFEQNGLDDKGRGIFIIRSLMDAVEYRKANGGYVLEMKKLLAG